MVPGKTWRIAPSFVPCYNYCTNRPLRQPLKAGQVLLLSKPSLTPGVPARKRKKPAEEPVFFHNDGEHDDVVYSDRVYSDGVYSDGVYSDGVYSGGAYTDGVHDDGVKGYADSHFNRRNRLRRGRPRRI